MKKENSGVKRVNYVDVFTKCKEVNTKEALLEVEVGSTGCTGCMIREGGSRTYLSIVNKKGDFLFRPVVDDLGQIIGVVIACCGNSAIQALNDSVQFCDNELNKEIYNLFKDSVKEFLEYREKNKK